MNDISFSHSFMFRTIEFDKFHYTDNRTGAPSHYFAYMLCGNCKITTDSSTVKINEGDIFLYSRQMQLSVILVRQSRNQIYFFGIPLYAEF